MFSVLPIPGIKPVVAPMFGLAAARRLANGHTELIVMPVSVPKSIAMEILLDTRENSAAIYFLPAVDQLQEQYEAEGRLVEVKKRFFAHPE